MAVVFLATALLVLIVALAADAAMIAIVATGARRIEDVVLFRLAADLLPLALVFTAFMTAITGLTTIMIRAGAQREADAEERLRPHFAAA